MGVFSGSHDAARRKSFFLSPRSSGCVLETARTDAFRHGPPRFSGRIISTVARCRLVALEFPEPSSGSTSPVAASRSCTTAVPRRTAATEELRRPWCSLRTATSMEPWAPVHRPPVTSGAARFSVSRPTARTPSCIHPSRARPESVVSY